MNLAMPPTEKRSACKEPRTPAPTLHEEPAASVGTCVFLCTSCNVMDRHQPCMGNQIKAIAVVMDRVST